MNDQKQTNNEIKIIEQRLFHLEHQSEVIIKSLETILGIIAKNSALKPSESNLIELQEMQAVDYIHNVVIPKGEHQGEEMGIQGFWQEIVFNFLKTQTLNFIGKALEELKNKAVSWSIDLADWLLERLQDILFSQYQSANDEQKEIFREKILEKFPNSPLANKLRDN